MKKLIIATSILFAFSATFAQEGKPGKKTPMSSKAPTSVSANENEAKPNVKPNVKPVGKTSTKPSPVVSKVSPVKGAKPTGPSTNRAAQSSKGASSRPEAVTEKQKPSREANARAAQSSRGASSRPEAVTEKQKPSREANARAAQSSKGASSREEAVTEKQKPSREANARAAQSSKGASSREEAVTEKQKPSREANARATQSSKGTPSREEADNSREEAAKEKPDADFCKGWKEGYMKAFSKATGERISPAKVPNCVSKGECEGYKCGYAAGVKNAERKLK